MPHTSRNQFHCLLGLSMLLLVVLTPNALAATPTPLLTPPPPPDATCVTSPQQTVCHFGGNFIGTIPELVACTSFVVDAEFSSTAQIKRVYDATGSLIKETRHIRFTGTLTNGTTALAMVYTGSFIVTLDIPAQTSSITGAQGRLLRPGGGVDVVLAGRLVTDFSQEPPVDLLVAGPKDFDAKVCAYLA